jgi:hypothetical protein
MFLSYEYRANITQSVARTRYCHFDDILSHTTNVVKKNTLWVFTQRVLEEFFVIFFLSTLLNGAKAG